MLTEGVAFGLKQPFFFMCYLSFSLCNVTSQRAGCSVTDGNAVKRVTHVLEVAAERARAPRPDWQKGQNRTG